MAGDHGDGSPVARSSGPPVVEEAAGRNLALVVHCGKCGEHFRRGRVEEAGVRRERVEGVGFRRRMVVEVGFRRRRVVEVRCCRRRVVEGSPPRRFDGHGGCGGDYDDPWQMNFKLLELWY